MNKKLPAEKYIKRNIKLVSMLIRLPERIKEEAQVTALLHGSSLNRFTEAAIKWYLVEIRKNS